jgi:hypothetical protein
MIKKVILVLMCFAWLTSCELPESITIKGRPGVYLALGSPFGDADDPNRLENQIDPEKIRTMMGGDTETVNIYNYTGDNTNVQTYLMQYPIAKMDLDLTKYVKNAMSGIDGEDSDSSYTIPDEIANAAQYPYYVTKSGPKLIDDDDDPLFKIPIADMAKLVLEVKDGPFGIEIDSSHGNIRVKVPAFDIDYDQAGVIEGNKIRFYNPTKNIFRPKIDMGGRDEIYVYVKIIGPSSGTIVFDMLFEWETAIINTEDNDNLKGKYAIKNSLGEYLGKDADFKRIEGYIYVDGVGDSATISLSTLDNDVNVHDLIGRNSPLLQRPRPGFLAEKANPVTVPLPQHSLEQDFIEMTDIFSGISQTALNYQVNIPEMEIRNTESNTKVITVDLLILLPLEFKILTPTNYPEYMQNYVKLEMGNIFSDTGDKDLFGRDGDDDIFDSIEKLSVFLEDFENNIFDSDRLVLLLAADNQDDPLKNYRSLLYFGDPKPSLELVNDDLPNPFIPRFEILLEKDNGTDYGTLSIKRARPGEGAVFNFFLTIEAQADINVNIDL